MPDPESVSDLLIYGEAAARTGDREEARTYLEWVLRDDADFGQQARAWYGLSRITDDPAGRRDCLENALAADPGHPEARHDLAVLEGRLAPGPPRDWRVADSPLPAQGPLARDGVRVYYCTQCGTPLSFDPAINCLACPACGFRLSLRDPRLATAVPEQDWVAAVYTERGHRWALPERETLTCRGCGATVVFAPGRVSATCPFCGAAYVVVANQPADLIAPQGVIPFAFTAGTALSQARVWLNTQRFRPADLSTAATFTPPRPIYLSFWTFDLTGEVCWSGRLPDLEGGPGDHERIFQSGRYAAFHDDLLVPATTSLPVERLASLRYDTTALVPYRPELLVDWPAEVYRVSLADASLAAREQARAATLARLCSEMGLSPDDTALHVDTTELTVLSYKLILAPVWITGYTYREQQYPALVNGQTGQVLADVPRNPLQRALGQILGDGAAGR